MTDFNDRSRDPVQPLINETVRLNWWQYLELPEDATEEPDLLPPPTQPVK